MDWSLLNALLIAGIGVVITYVFAGFKSGLEMHMRQCDQRYDELQTRIQEVLGFMRTGDANLEAEKLRIAATHNDLEARITRRIERIESQLDRRAEK